MLAPDRPNSAPVLHRPPSVHYGMCVPCDACGCALTAMRRAVDSVVVSLCQVLRSIGNLSLCDENVFPIVDQGAVPELLRGTGSTHAHRASSSVHMPVTHPFPSPHHCRVSHRRPRQHKGRGSVQNGSRRAEESGLHPRPRQPGAVTTPSGLAGTRRSPTADCCEQRRVPAPHSGSPTARRQWRGTITSGRTAAEAPVR